MDQDPYSDHPDPNQPDKKPAEDRRRFYRVHAQLRYRILPDSGPPRPWMHRTDGQGSALHRPETGEIDRAEGLLDEAPLRSVDLSEGGIRVRFPEGGLDAGVLRDDGTPTEAEGLRILFEVPEREKRILFHLPVRAVRIDSLPWARFVAFAFQHVPEGIRRRLEGLVLAFDRQRLRRDLPGAGEEAEEMASRLRELETRSSPSEEPVRRIHRRNTRYFP